MAKKIIAQGGYIDTFIGDTIMAVFRGNFHLDRAIDAALAGYLLCVCLFSVITIKQ